MLLRFLHFLLLAGVLCISKDLCAQIATPDSTYKLLQGRSYVQSKNYYLLTLFSDVADVKAMLESDAKLAVIVKTKADSLTGALRECGKDGLCYIRRMKFTDAEIQAVSNRLRALYKPENALGKLVQNHLIPSGTYILYQKFTPSFH